MTRKPSPTRVLCADPAWKFGDKLPGPGRGADKFYPTMTIAEIKAFPLPDIQDNAVLFLWRVSAMVEEAYEVARAWGFTPKTELVWEKRTAKGKKHFGMGRIVRATHETCIIATRGRPVVQDKSIRSSFEAPTGEHSEKPDRFYEIVQQLYLGPYTELFARKVRVGWRQHGNELGKLKP